MASIWTRLAHRDATGGRMRSYPELAEFPDGRLRHKAYQSAVTEVARRSHFPILVRLGFLGHCVAVFAAMSYLKVDVEFMRRSAAVALCLYVTLEIWLYRWAIPRVRKELRRMLNKRSYHCHTCDYPLFGNHSGRCPECGAEIPDDQRRLILSQGEKGVEFEPGVSVE